MNGLGFLMVTVCIGITGLYGIAAGIVALINGIGVLSTGGRGKLGGVRLSAVMLIVAIIAFDIVALASGIVVLCFSNERQIRAYLA